ncbi:DNA-3-methyladenine glycosylase family protein [Okibacterium endophyticum]
MHPTLAEHSITAELDEIVAGLRIADGAADDSRAEHPGPANSPSSATSATPATSVRAEPAVRTRYTPRHPLDLSSTLSPLARGGDGPCFRRTPGGAWLTLRTPIGPATLHIEREAHAVEAAAWGAGAEWALERVPSLLGADDDWSDLDLSSSRLLTEVRRRNPGLRLARTGTVFELLVPSVLEQKVTCHEAWRSWRTLVRRHGEAAPGPAPEGLVVAPSAEQWRDIPSWEWHEAGVGPQRSQTVVRVSRVADALERTAGVDAAEASARMTSLPGIGVWTAAEVTSRSHGDPDAVSVGDYHLASTVGAALTGSPVDDDCMLELLEPWHGQRQRVIRLIWMSGVRRPRRGPRTAVPDHRRR